MSKEQDKKTEMGEGKKSPTNGILKNLFSSLFNFLGFSKPKGQLESEAKKENDASKVVNPMFDGQSLKSVTEEANTESEKKKKNMLRKLCSIAYSSAKASLCIATAQAPILPFQTSAKKDKEKAAKKQGV